MKKKYKILLIVLSVLIVIRLFLPYIVLHFANKELAAMDGYFGKIRDIDISLYRGAYVLDSIYINKLDSVNNAQTPFMAAKTVDLSIEWNSLFHGRIVGELEFIDPILLFTKDKTELSQVQKDTNDFRKVLKALMPLKINRFEIKNGKLAYKDLTSNPKVDIALHRAHIIASNLSNVVDSAMLPSKVIATANVYEGYLELDMKLDALSDLPLFDMNVKVEKMLLTPLNDFFQAYARFDVNQGEFNMYTELAAKEGKFVGYVKPLIKDLDVVGPEDREDEFLRTIWEGLVGLVGVVVENPKKDQVATKIPLEGNFEETQVGVLTAIAELLRNAFIKALYPAIEYQVNIKSLEQEKKNEPGILKRLFSSEKKESKDKS